MADNNFPLTTAPGGTVNVPSVTAQPFMEGAAEASAAQAAETAAAENVQSAEGSKGEACPFRFKEFLKNGPAYRTLGHYSPEEIDSVLDFLDLEGYDYRLSQGESILVPVDQYATIREQMLRRGIAVDKESNDEGDSILMTDSGFGVSQRLEGERIKHGREMQLARAIERIDGIDHATVLLAIPKENVFARQQSRPSAAVAVTLQHGACLSPENVNSIRFMVSSSVQNLLSKDVTVTDQNGRLLSAERSVEGTTDKLQKEFEMRTLREEVMDVPVDLRVKMMDAEVTLRQILNFKPGDILRVDMPDDLLVYIEDLPSCHAKLGRTKDKQAIKISDVLKRPPSMKSDISFIKGSGVNLDDDDELEEFDDD